MTFACYDQSQNLNLDPARLSSAHLMYAILTRSLISCALGSGLSWQKPSRADQRPLNLLYLDNCYCFLRLSTSLFLLGGFTTVASLSCILPVVERLGLAVGVSCVGGPQQTGSTVQWCCHKYL